MRERFDSFNGLRAYAALGILLMHYLANIDDSITITLTQSFPLLYGRLIPFLTMFVYMFFIVSAFSMCCGYYERFRVVDKKSSFDTETFYSKRYSRIWPFFALLVMIDFAMNPNLEEFYQVFADLTLAFNFLPNPHIEVIGVGWFLGVVFMFYMIFPWFVFLLQCKKRAWFAMTVAVAFHVVLVQYFLTSQFCTEYQISSPRHNIVYSFPFFVAGGLLYLYRNYFHLESIWTRITLLIMAIIATGLQFTQFAPSPFGENIFWVGIIFVLWVMYALTGGISIAGIKLLDNRFVEFLGDLSMEIYLCHMVIFRAIEKVHLDNYISNPHLLYWSWCLLGIIGSVAFSWIIKMLVFPKLGKYINI